MAAYGATFDIDRPESFNRVHVVIRILEIVVLSILASVLGWIFGVFYLIILIIPILAAVLISQKGAERYLAESPETMTKWLRYIIAFYAYLLLLTDKLPNENPVEYLRFEVSPSGTPTAGNALLRIVLAIPSALVLAILAIIGLALALFAAVMILINETYPEAIYDYLRGLVRWEARLLSYLASLVDAYPPFALDTGPESLSTSS